jgi:hypothetical protein
LFSVQDGAQGHELAHGTPEPAASSVHELSQALGLVVPPAAALGRETGPSIFSDEPSPKCGLSTANRILHPVRQHRKVRPNEDRPAQAGLPLLIGLDRAPPQNGRSIRQPHARPELSPLSSRSPDLISTTTSSERRRSACLDGDVTARVQRFRAGRRGRRKEDRSLHFWKTNPPVPLRGC